jgi:hypothetical protein
MVQEARNGLYRLKGYKTKVKDIQQRLYVALKA